MIDSDSIAHSACGASIRHFSHFSSLVGMTLTGGEAGGGFDGAVRSLSTGNVNVENNDIIGNVPSGHGVSISAVGTFSFSDCRVTACPWPECRVINDTARELGHKQKRVLMHAIHLQ